MTEPANAAASEPAGAALPGAATPATPASEPKGRGGELASKQSKHNSFITAVVEGNTITVSLLAILTAAIVGGLLNAFTTASVLHAWGNLFSSPGHAIASAWDTAIGAYVELFQGSVFNPHTVAALFQQASMATAIHDGYLGAVFGPLSETAVYATPLILCGLAVALPYQAGLFNIGAESQFIGGAVFATYIGYGINMPFGLHVAACVLGGFIGGAATGWLVGELKARTGAHEVIVTIMLNYVMQYLLAYVLSYPYLMQAHGTPNLITPPIASDAHLPLLFGSGLRVNAGFLIALACAVGVWWLLSRTTTGFEFRSVGQNPSAARVAGVNVERSWVMAMLIAGGLAGLAGAAVIQGTDFTLNYQSYGTFGIDAITVALLGRGKPLGVVLASLLFGAMYAGAPLMESATNTPSDMVQVLEGLIVLFVAAPACIRALYRLRAARATTVGQTMSKGWNA